MHRIDTSTAQVDKFGAGKNGFTGGNPQTGELPTALDQDFFDSVQEELCNLIEQAGLTLQKGKRTQLAEAIQKLFSSGRLLRIVDFSTSGSYVPGAGTKFIIVEVTGGGGGGGASNSTGATSVSVGAGGGAGGTAISKLNISDITTPVPVMVGNGGAAANSSNIATSGGQSSFGSYLSATGGDFGVSGTTITQGDTAMVYNGGGGQGVNGNLDNMIGGSGGFGIILKYGYESGWGGRSYYSSGGNPIVTLGTPNPGFPGRKGSGGSGGFGANNSPVQNGGAGGSGFVRIWEYA